MNFGFEPLQKDTAKSTSSTNSKQTVPSTTSTLPSINNKAEDGKIKIRQSGKIRNYVRYATKHLNASKTIPVILSGSGNTISMTITIAEIIKRTFVDLSDVNVIHQYNSIAPPSSSKEKSTPCITIYLGWTKEVVIPTEERTTKFAQSQPGYQPPEDANAGTTYLHL